MTQLIKCPKCNGKDWSSDYWYCPHCNYYVHKEETLLEMNQDNFDGRNRGDEPQENESYWMREQKDLTEEMIDECLPKSEGYSWKVNFPLVSWLGGETEYHENDPQETLLFKFRHEKELVERGYYVIEGLPNGQLVKVPRYPYGTGSQPTKIKISKSLLTYEGSYEFDKMGYFPVIPHETAHASPEVKRHPKFEPFSSQYDPSGKGTWGHDLIWRDKNREFYDRLTQKGYKEKVKDRFKELRKIKGEDGDKYG